ncbi:hypothetical protein [Aquisalinus flavus]|uniref:Sulfotransferase family protein n=1 Tax=Aquisalinus flavus TaxID=1526572 RepID=A0A8J2Y578_9PROT|nr:hypothetical protein [Aquisalinus flavus]MBD0426232.1 hypothetical protein [Aquisalinus flavus]UNE48196.1 hypothetical protein FF099_09095 [Aquisalinus flavus]GGD09562.1 hypothetical protein GCM10011342_18050 [Aquisalinus flavus]
MIFGKNYLFIHTPKTGGMSVSRWLLNNADGPLNVCTPASSFDHTRTSIEFDDVEPRLTLIDGKRHEVVSEAADVLEAQGIDPETIPLVFSVTRDPVQLLLSYYKHVRKPWVVKFRHGADGKLTGDTLLASEGNFSEFARNCQFYNKSADFMRDYYVDNSGRIKKVHYVPLEFLNEFLTERFRNHKRCGRFPMQVRNKSAESFPESEIDKDTEDFIYDRYAFLHEIHEKAKQRYMKDA